MRYGDDHTGRASLREIHRARGLFPIRCPGGIKSRRAESSNQMDIMSAYGTDRIAKLATNAGALKTLKSKPPKFDRKRLAPGVEDAIRHVRS